MSSDNLDQMSREQAVSWFAEASDDQFADVVRSARKVDDRGDAPAASQASIPLMLTSIRLPVELVGLLDEVAAAEGMNRSEAIRAAVTAYVDERRGSASVSEAERALEVLRRVVGEHTHRQAA